MCIKSSAWINERQCCATTFLLTQYIDVLEFPSHTRYNKDVGSNGV